MFIFIIPINTLGAGVENLHAWKSYPQLRGLLSQYWEVIERANRGIEGGGQIALQVRLFELEDELRDNGLDNHDFGMLREETSKLVGEKRTAVESSIKESVANDAILTLAEQIGTIPIKDLDEQMAVILDGHENLGRQFESGREKFFKTDFVNDIFHRVHAGFILLSLVEIKKITFDQNVSRRIVEPTLLQLKKLVGFVRQDSLPPETKAALSKLSDVGLPLSVSQQWKKTTSIFQDHRLNSLLRFNIPLAAILIFGVFAYAKFHSGIFIALPSLLYAPYAAFVWAVWDRTDRGLGLWVLKRCRTKLGALEPKT